MSAPATVVSCLYGTDYERFTSEWAYAIRQLDPRPDAVIVVSDRAHDIPGAQAFVDLYCDWQHPQAYYLQQAVELARTDWVWIVDIDDLAMPDALAGLDEVAADVWMAGLEQDGNAYVPPPMTAEQILDAPGNAIPAGSMIRREAFMRAGGFPDVAFQDWGLWRRLAACGALFESSGRVQYRYRRHEHARSAVELTPDLRGQHVAEMVESEAVLVG